MSYVSFGLIIWSGDKNDLLDSVLEQVAIVNCSQVGCDLLSKKVSPLSTTCPVHGQGKYLIGANSS